jgi:hypothetical protein
VTGSLPVINMLSSLVTSNETDGLDIGVVADGIDCVNASMDNVEDTRGQTCREDELK